MKLTRRHFLASLGVAAATGGLGLAFKSRKPTAKNIRYCVSSPEKDDLSGYVKRQDLSWVRPDRALTIPGFPEGFRSLLTMADQTGHTTLQSFVPGLIHSGRFFGEKVLLITRGQPSVLYSLAADSLEMIGFSFPPSGYVFGGHLIDFNSKGLFALTLNSTTAGRYDAVGIYDGHDLRELHRFSSYGFQAHDLTLSPDRKRLYIGHYGSNFKSGPYSGIKVSPLEVFNSGGTIPSEADGIVYPGSVSIVDPVSGKMLGRESHNENGPQGHLAVSSTGQIFLSKNPPLLVSREDVLENPAFAQGDENKNRFSDFYVSSKISGTSVIVDDKYKQFILPLNKENKILYGNCADPGKIQSLALNSFGEFGTPHGIQFHPDGVHYVVSCEGGFAVFTRGSHIFSKEMSFKTHLMEHSHFCIG